MCHLSRQVNCSRPIGFGEEDVLSTAVESSQARVPDTSSSLSSDRKPPVRLTAHRFRYMLEYAGFWVIAKLASILPLELCASASAWCWRLLGRFSSRQRRAATQLAQSLPELSGDERHAILSQVWDNLGRNFAEGFHIRAFIDDPLRFAVARESALREFAQSTKSFVIVSLHSANWELTALGLLRAACA